MTVRFATDISRARIDRYLATAPDHLRPILLVVRDSGCAWLNIPQKAGRFDPPTDRPFVAILGDDFDVAMGPAGFHRKSVRRLLARSRFISVVAADPQVLAYATPALGAAGLGVNGTIIETRPEFEMEWLDLVKAEAPDAQLIIVSVRETEH